MACLLVFILLSACRSAPTDSPSPIAGVADLSPTPTPINTTCADIDANWGHNWPGVITALESLIAADQSCGPEPLLSKKYATHFNYATALENDNDLAVAIAQYQAAFAIDSRRREAFDALLRLDALPPPTPPTCASASPANPDPAIIAAPDLSRFIIVQGNQLSLAGHPFIVRGVNYYPRHAPWERFFSEADPAEMAQELEVIRAAGFNTLRIFLSYRPLFTCQPEAAIPNETAFALLDTLFQRAAERDLKLIITLNDVPDLTFRPLYTDWAHYDAQTVYIVRRYRHNPALLAWDARNGGDHDLGRFSEADILGWLAHITNLIRQHDPHHLITAGWSDDPTATAPYVDLLAVQHWDAANELPARLATYPADNKPLLLLSTGFHSWAESPDMPHSEAEQSAYLAEMIRTAEAAGMAGWLIWTAFDFVPAPGQTATAEHHFGLWRTDLSQKAVLEALPLQP